jgi:hypothetical protein
MSLLQKKSNPAAIAVNNAGSGHGEMVGDDPLLEGLESNTKYGREIMHDDKGAETGLRGRPDYGEPDSYTEEMNKKNAKEAEDFWSHPNEFSVPAEDPWYKDPQQWPAHEKGTPSKKEKGVAPYHIAVRTPKIALGVEMYISSVEFGFKNATHVEKFSFTADRAKARIFHRLTANEIVRQLGSPDFGIQAKAVAVTKKKPQPEFPPPKHEDAYDLWEDWDSAVPFTAHKDGFVNIGDTHEAAFAEHHFKGKIPVNYSGWEDLATTWGDEEHARGWVAKDGSRMMLWDDLREALQDKTDLKYSGLKVALKALKARGLVKPKTEVFDKGGESGNYCGTLQELGLY